MNLRKITCALAVGALLGCSDDTPPATTPDSGTPMDDVPVDMMAPDAPEDTAPDQAPADAPEDTAPDQAPADAPDDVPPPDVGPMCMPGEMVCGGGCVDTQTSTLHCGMCDHACGASEVCRAGSCQPSVTCMTGETLCGGGCVNTATNNSHCGMCNNACAAGQTCTGGTCMTPRMCPMGQTDCAPTAPSPSCVDLASSAMNCGSCGNACMAGETCVMGVCQAPACPSGQTRCTAMGVSTCADTMTDNANCGACGNACMAGQACMGGTCRATCAAPRRECMVGGMTVCLDVQTDNANCGACGTACTGGQTCQMGACRCPTGRTACGASCVDTQSDEANCGSCGHACGAGQTCQMGACRCPTGRTLCGASCVDTSSDTMNCGACGRACTAPSTCNSGTCNSLCGVGTTSCGGRCVAITTFLTDNANCGRCGNACGAGTRCVSGTCRPTNDDRVSAAVIVPNPAREVTVTGNTTSSTHDGPTVPCGCTSAGNVWYRFAIPTEGVVYFDTAGSAYDTSLFITSSAGVAVPGQAASGNNNAGLCNDDAGCGTGGGFTSGLQSRTAGVLAAGTYYVAVGGCGSGAFTLHMQYVPRTVGQTFFNARLTGAGNTGVQTLMTSGSTAGTCGGSGGAENVAWYLTCGAAERQLFSVCRSDPSALFTRRPSTGSSTLFDPVLYARSAQTGAQVACNDDSGPSDGAGIDCRGVIPFFSGSTVGPLDSLHRGSRLANLNTPRGVGLIFVDTLGTSSGMRYNMRFSAP